MWVRGPRHDHLTTQELADTAHRLFARQQNAQHRIIASSRCRCSRLRRTLGASVTANDRGTVRVWGLGCVAVSVFRAVQIKNTAARGGAGSKPTRDHVGAWNRHTVHTKFTQTNLILTTKPTHRRTCTGTTGVTDSRRDTAVLAEGCRCGRAGANFQF